MVVPPWLNEWTPFLKGAVGWSAAGFINESLIKPSRARRRLAHVLAEEVAQNLRLLVLQTEFFKVAPSELPADFKLSDTIYRAVVARIGELPDTLTGDLLLFYLRVENINTMMKDILIVHDLVEVIKRDPDRNGGIERLVAKQEYLRRAILVYKESFAVGLEQADLALRRLRVEETFLGAFGYRFRRKPMLNPGEARRDVLEKLQRLK